MRNPIAIATFAALAAFGCSTTKPVELPNGRSGFMLKCHHPGDCEARAVKVCPHGFSVVEGMGKPGHTQVVTCNGGDG
jgi:hypothetical protein